MTSEPASPQAQIRFYVRSYYVHKIWARWEEIARERYVALDSLAERAYLIDCVIGGMSRVSDDFEEIVAATSETFRIALRRAYDAGRDAGKAEAAADLRSRMMRVLDLGASVGAENVIAAVQTGWVVPDGPWSGSDRALPGSVKPAITKAVMNHPEGLTTEQVRKLTGAKANTVRGTLWTLSTTEGIIERRDGKWFPTRKTNEAADGQSAAPVSQQVNPLTTGSHQSGPVKGQERQVIHDNNDLDDLDDVI
jgi:hypothetical protein